MWLALIFFAAGSAVPILSLRIFASPEKARQTLRWVEASRRNHALQMGDFKMLKLALAVAAIALSTGLAMAQDVIVDISGTNIDADVTVNTYNYYNVPAPRPALTLFGLALGGVCQDSRSEVSLLVPQLVGTPCVVPVAGGLFLGTTSY